MVNPALGTKRHCQSCDENYYDLNKSPITCPHCNVVFDPEVLLKSRKSKPIAAAAPKKVEVAEDVEADDDLSDDIENDDDDNTANEDVLDDDADLAVITPKSDGDDDIISIDEAIEDELDDADDEDE